MEKLLLLCMQESCCATRSHVRAMAGDTHQPRSRLEQLPVELGQQIWNKLLHFYDGRPVMATSRGLRDLFGPAVEGLRLWLEADQKPNVEWFRGLHPRVQPRRVEVWAPGYDEYNIRAGAHDTSDSHVHLANLFCACFPLQQVTTPQPSGMQSSNSQASVTVQV
jgi:hypothetical protein